MFSIHISIKSEINTKKKEDRKTDTFLNSVWPRYQNQRHYKRINLTYQNKLKNPKLNICKQNLAMLLRKKYDKVNLFEDWRDG